MGIKDLFSETSLNDALILKSTLMASVYIENQGSENFVVRPLPVEAQFAPVYGLAVTDINDDGNLDILSIGNSYASETLNGLYDAGIGNYLKGDGAGNFQSSSVNESGFFVDGDAKALAQLTLGNGDQIFIATQNRDSIKIFRRSATTPVNTTTVKISPTSNSATVELVNGKKRKHEFYHGSGYLSSSSLQPARGNSIVRIVVAEDF
jgi:hypothetical protein